MQDTKLTQKYVGFSYTNNELSEKLRKKISFKITLEIKKKNLGINFTKGVKDLYPENYKNLLKELEKDTNK